MAEDPLAKIIRYAVQNHCYLDISGLKEYLESENVEFSKQVLNQTVHRLVKKGEIYDAGRGWYSSLENKYSLHKDPIQEDVEELRDHFPFLEFCVWSNEQIANHYHHVPTKFMVFVYTEKNTENAVYDYLIGTDKYAYLDPKQSDMDNFQLEKHTYIVRPSVSRQPCEEYFSQIEKLLVDLSIENEKFNLMDDHEYKTIFENVCGRSRIRISQLLSYSSERNRRDRFEELIQVINENFRNRLSHQ